MSTLLPFQTLQVTITEIYHLFKYLADQRFLSPVIEPFEVF